MFVSTRTPQLEFIQRGRGFWALRLLSGLALSVALFPAEALAGDYYVQAGAAAGGTGAISKPFNTVQAGLNAAQAGDTVWLRAGTYYGAWSLPRSGTEGAPITIAAYAPAGNPMAREKVMVVRAPERRPGIDGVGSWRNVSGKLWSIKLNAIDLNPAGRNYVSLGGVVLQEARWPDSERIPDVNKDGAARASASTVLAENVASNDLGEAGTPDRLSYTVDQSTGLSLAGFATDALKGARLFFGPGKQWSATRARVDGNSGQSLSFLYSLDSVASTNVALPRARDWFVIYGSLALLNRPDEYYLDLEGRDGEANTLYVRSESSPADRPLVVGGGEMLRNLSARQNFRFVGFEMRGGTIWTDNTDAAVPGAKNILFEDVVFNLNVPSYGGGTVVTISGENWTFRGCEFKNSFGGGLQMGGGWKKSGTMVYQTARQILVEDCVFRDVYGSIYVSNNTFAALRQSANLTVRRVTCFDVGSHGLSFDGYDSDFSRIHVYHFGRLTSDISGINLNSETANGDFLNVRVHHSWVYDTVADRERGPDDLARWEGGNGIRVDSGFSGKSGFSGVYIDHNVTWGRLTDGFQIFSRPANASNAKIYLSNNTTTADINLLSVSRDLSGNSVAERGSCEDMMLVNNVATGISVPGSPTTPPRWLQKNLLTTQTRADNLTGDPKFSGVVERLLEPGADSPLYNTGASNLNNGVVAAAVPNAGTSPDIGAIERGDAAWIAGALVRPGQVPALRVTGRTSLDGTRYAVVSNLPPGRLLPLEATLSLGGQSLSKALWAYDPVTNQGEAWFALSTSITEGAAASIDLDGAGAANTPIALDATAVGFSPAVTSVAWDPVARTLSVSGTGLRGYPVDLKAVKLDGAASDDLRNRPALVSAPTFGIPTSELALVVAQRGQAYSMPWNLDRAAGERFQGWTLLPNSARWFGSAAATTYYVARRSNAGPSADRLDFKTWPELNDPSLIARLLPEKIALADATPINSWTDSGPSARVFAAAGSGKPKFSVGQLTGLPAVRYTGGHWLESAGPSGSGDLLILSAYANKLPGVAFAPGSTPWQRLAGVGINEVGIDNDSLNLLVGSAVGGTPLPIETASVLRGKLAFSAPRSPLRLGRNSNPSASLTTETFVGWQGETILASNSSNWMLTQLTDYLSVKYRTQPAGRITDGTGEVISAPQATLDGVALTPLEASDGTLVFSVPGSIDPYLGISLNLTLPGGTASALTLNSAALPETLTNLTASTQDPERIDLAWKNRVGATSPIIIERAEGLTGVPAFVEIAQLPAGTLAYSDFTRARPLRYRVRAAQHTEYSAIAAISTRHAFGIIEAESCDASSGLVVNTGGLDSIGSGHWARYANLNFNDGPARLVFRLTRKAVDANPRFIYLHADSETGTRLETLSVPDTLGWAAANYQEVSLTLSASTTSRLTGIQSIALVFGGGSGVCNLDWIRFEAALPQPSAPPTPASLTARILSASSLLDWPAASGATRYHLERFDETWGYIRIAEPLAAQPGFPDPSYAGSGLPAYRIRSASYGGVSAYRLATASSASALASWRYSKFGSLDPLGPASDSADFDGDGVSNLLEYALGGDPTVVESTLLPVSTIDGSGRLTLSFKRAHTDVSYTVQGSTDLQAWSDLATRTANAALWSGVAVGAAITEANGTVTFTDSTADLPRRFLRLKVTSP